VNLADQPLGEIPTKNPRVRVLAIDDLTAAILRAQIDDVEQRAEFAKVLLVDPYVFIDAADGSVPWKPDAVSQYFGRTRKRIGLDHLDFHHLRKFMEIYGQEMGYSVTQVAMRAGHDPSIAAKQLQRKGERDGSSTGGRRGVVDRGLAEALRLGDRLHVAMSPRPRCVRQGHEICLGVAKCLVEPSPRYALFIRVGWLAEVLARRFNRTIGVEHGVVRAVDHH
jgi:hypothetical protein